MSQTRTIGVLGGGQLGRMMAHAAQRIGVKLIVLDPAGARSPAGQITESIEGSFDDPVEVMKLAERCDVVTVEIEHVNAAALAKIEAEGKVVVQPSSATISLIQDKYKQKVYLQEKKIAVADFVSVETEEDIAKVGERWGYPVMLKTRRLAYDGKGNAVVANAAAIAEAFAKLGGNRGKDVLYVERWVPYVKELAVMVARSTTGEVATYPTVETVHENSICLTTVTPPAVSAAASRAAQALATDAVKKLTGAGIFGVEMFLLADGSVILNEIAPRPHNSGHYTIEACGTCQFEMHLRAVLGLPLGDPSLQVGAAGMFNLLGGAGGAVELDAVSARALTVPGTRVHLYGKPDCRPGRKMGHINIMAPDAVTLAERIAAVRGLSASSADSKAQAQQPVVGIIMGSDSDLPTMKAAAEVLESFGVPFELSIVSAHRTPERMFDYARTALGRGLRVIIAGAGGAAHLPGMVASMTVLPVIGVPVATQHLGGEDSLLSIVQMPKGIPVATVAIGNAANAGLLAVRMLGGRYNQQMQAYQDKLREEVDAKAEKVERVGYKAYSFP